jgi:hypothetical protein
METKQKNELLEIFTKELNVDRTKIESLLSQQRVEVLLRALYGNNVSVMLKRHK